MTFHIEQTTAEGRHRVTFAPVDDATARRISTKLYNSDGVLSVRRVPVGGRMV